LKTNLYLQSLSYNIGSNILRRWPVNLSSWFAEEIFKAFEVLIVIWLEQRIRYKCQIIGTSALLTTVLVVTFLDERDSAVVYNGWSGTADNLRKQQDL